MNEGQFERQHVQQLADLHGWQWCHFSDSRREVRPGVFVGDSKARGWPDIVLARERVVFAELKSDTGQLRLNQVQWLDALTEAGAECYLWKPDDLPEIGRILSRRWRYLPRGDRALPVAASEVPLLVSSNGGKKSWTPWSLWIAGHGRYDYEGRTK